MKKPLTILVNVCCECGADNWQNNLFELKFKRLKESIWLCPTCVYNVLMPNFLDMNKIKIDYRKSVSQDDKRRMVK
jgi:hypothetical protein